MAVSTADSKVIGARLRAEREAPPRWSRPALARLLRDAADPRDRERMPHVASLTDQIKQWENGRWIPEPRYRALYAKVTGRSQSELFGGEPPDARTSGDDAVALADWLQQSNIGDGTIDYLQTAVRRLAFGYARRPPLDVMREARELQTRINRILRSGRQRIAQTQALLATSAELFALVNLLAGDVGRYGLADAYGYAAWTCAHEADSDAARALVLCAQSKTARWEGRIQQAADLAHRGFELAPVDGRGRVLLAVSEATALQLRGDIDSATGALELAHRAQDQNPTADALADAWSCPRPRQATYALQVGLGAGDPGRVLRSVQDADEAWADGAPWVYGTWAQVRIGAALAHVMRGDPEGAAAELDEVFDLGSEFRVVTITGRLAELSRRLRHSRYDGDPRAADLRDQIRAFQAGSLDRNVATLEAL
ncbi:hypothetical protein [Actinomadura fibrosa]|uniref:XRE family transcriptional regulator n=1 Tax=Actinomadura fibrosa TaxID=111802 RepID=A0ABW2Y2A0_9ACTN|nr:hypothetical protein [Actinomadura fibrosa]